MTESNVAPESGVEDLIAINEGRAKTYGLLASSSTSCMG